MTVPDSFTPALGFREWRIESRFGLVPRLVALYNNNSWKPGENKRYCSLAGYFDDISANAGSSDHKGLTDERICGCGFYAYHSHTSLTTKSRAHSSIVVGAVIGWGDLRVHCDGWRSEYAEVVALLAPPGNRDIMDSNIRAVAQRYGVPVCRTWTTLVAEGLKHGQVIDKSVRPPEPRLSDHPHFAGYGAMGAWQISAPVSANSFKNLAQTQLRNTNFAATMSKAQEYKLYFQDNP